MAITEFIFIVFFFFFQAEDGIRDADVTGVQTCALPISAFLQGRAGGLQEFFRLENSYHKGSRISAINLHWGKSVQFQVIRSEERRVGKECRSRWSPYH